MKILVAGGSGFLGSHLIENLLNNNHQVICADNYITGNINNLKSLINNKNLTVLNHDITVPLDIKIDGIFNLACPASPKQYQINPIKTFETCVIGSINLLNLAKQNNCRILQASTSEIYGDPHSYPQKESYWGNVNPIGIRSCYDEGKRAAESLFFDYMRQHGVNIVIARIFNTYGPKMSVNDGRVVSNFIIQALKDDPITIYGNGNQIRSFCYVDDLINGLVRLFFSNIHDPINLGNPSPIKISDLAKEIIDITESKSIVVYKEKLEDDPFIREPDISKAKTLLDWTPNINRKNGLINTINYFKEII